MPGVGKTGRGEDLAEGEKRKKNREMVDGSLAREGRWGEV